MNDDNETQEWTDDMQTALEEVSEMIGNESCEYVSGLIVQYEAMYPGFGNRAQELVDLYRKLNPVPIKENITATSTLADAIIVGCIVAGLSWSAWLLYLLIITWK